MAWPGWVALTQEAPNKLRAGAVLPPEGFAGTGGSKFTHMLLCRRPLCLVLWSLLGGWLPPEQAIQEGETEQLRRKSCVLGRLISGVAAQPPPSPRPPNPGTVGEGDCNPVMGARGPNQRPTTTGHLLLMLQKGGSSECKVLLKIMAPLPYSLPTQRECDSLTLPGTEEVALASCPLDRPHMSSNSPLRGPRIPRGDSGNLESRTHPTGGQAVNWRVGRAPHTRVQAWVVGSWIRWGLHPEPADPQLPTWATVLAQAWGPPDLTKRRTREARRGPLARAGGGERPGPGATPEEQVPPQTRGS